MPRVPMTVSVTSHFADEAWTHTLHIRKNQSDNVLLERLFRVFNRVTVADANRLDRWGYTLPSLSSGDTVVLDYGEDCARAYRVEAVGFTRLTGRAAARYLASPEQRDRGDRIVDRVTTVLDDAEYQHEHDRDWDPDR